MSASTIDLRLRHRQGGFTLDVDLSVPASGVIALFGPSGAGKSTIVAAMAGLLRPDTGYVRVAGQVMTDTSADIFVPPHRRRAGLVFQDARLFPHLSVRDNLRYGLRRAGPGAAAIDYQDVVALLGIGHLPAARPATLSGGERQRVAIGRALLSQPLFLLMDEPLASLDSARKAEILPFVARLRDRLSLPVVYVTHALDEVAQLADTVVLLDQGRVVAAGPVTTMFARADLPLATRADAGALIAATIDAHDRERGLTRLRRGGLVLQVPLMDHAVGTRVRARIPAREVILAASAPTEISIQNMIAGRVGLVVDDAATRSALVEVICADVTLLSRITSDAAHRLALSPGSTVLALVKSMSVQVPR